jgi:exodeoxyribonuclease I
MSQAFLSLCGLFPSATTVGVAQAHYKTMPTRYKKWVTQQTLVDYLCSKDRRSIYWHDYEAGGISARSDAPLQHAALRTDEELRYLDEPIDWYCQLAGDKLPHPEAIAITQINPLHCQENGLSEPVFFRRINQEMSNPGSCVAGYNSIKYDEEMTRFGLWRNQIPVYDREFRNNNSRWDLLPLAAAVYALAPSAIDWPIKEETGLVSLRLEDIAKQNNIAQDNAHNAVDDVKATIDVARLFKQSAPDIWDFSYQHRNKRAISHHLAPGKISLLVQTVLGAENAFVSPVLIIGWHPLDKSRVVGVKLRDIDALRRCYKIPTEEIIKRLYARKEDLERAERKRPPLTTIKVNACPAVFPLSMITHSPALMERVGFDPNETQTIAHKIFNHQPFIDKLMATYNENLFKNKDVVDADIALYSAGFADGIDKINLQRMQTMPTDVAFSPASDWVWKQPVFKTLWERASAKCLPLTDNSEEKQQWWDYCKHRLQQPVTEGERCVNFTNVDAAIVASELTGELKAQYIQYIEELKKTLRI